MNDIQMKTVVILNDKITNGKAVNTAVHLAQQAGAEKPDVAGKPVCDASGEQRSGIPVWGNVVLGTSPEDLKAIIRKARERAASNPELLVVEFPEQGFTTSNDDEYRAAMALASAESLTYYGCLIAGPRKEVDRVSKGISTRLWSGNGS